MMRDLVVHLDGGPDDDVRLSHADSLCRIVPGLRVTGVYLNPMPEDLGFFGLESGLATVEAITALERQLRAIGNDKAAHLHERLRRYDAPSELRRRDDRPSRLPAFMASQARCADLSLAMLPRASNEYAWHAVFEAMLFGSGRPVLGVPPKCPARSAMRTILVGWNDTAHAARAVGDALPLLVAATRVVLLVIGRNPDDDRGASDLAAHLDRHGVQAEVLRRDASSSEVPGLIRSEAAAVSADLVVIGAYGHTRLREWILGGATAELIESAEVPLLLAH